MSFTDDAGNEESLTSAATDAVAVPLTASLENTTDTHDGQNVFTFELRFSEEFSLSYKTLRDHALTVSGGAVENAGRITKGSNLRWWVTVRLDANGQVSFILPVTTDCASQGAVCTRDGRKLSNELVLAVSGPGQWKATRRTSTYGPTGEASVVTGYRTDEGLERREKGTPVLTLRRSPRCAPGEHAPCRDSASTTAE